MGSQTGKKKKKKGASPSKIICQCESNHVENTDYGRYKGPKHLNGPKFKKQSHCDYKSHNNMQKGMECPILSSNQDILQKSHISCFKTVHFVL